MRTNDQTIQVREKVVEKMQVRLKLVQHVKLCKLNVKGEEHNYKSKNALCLSSKLREGRALKRVAAKRQVETLEEE